MRIFLYCLLLFPSLLWAENYRFSGKGLIGNVLIHISIKERAGEITGFYRYERYQTQIPITGIRKGDLLKLRADEVEQFQLKIVDNGLDGTWVRGNKKRPVKARKQYKLTNWSLLPSYESCVARAKDDPYYGARDTRLAFYNASKEVIQLFREQDKEEIIKRLVGGKRGVLSKVDKDWLRKLPFELLYEKSYVETLGEQSPACYTFKDSLMVNKGQLWVNLDGSEILRSDLVEMFDPYTPSMSLLKYGVDIIPISCFVEDDASGDTFESLQVSFDRIDDSLSKSGVSLYDDEKSYLKKKYVGRHCDSELKGFCPALMPHLSECVDSASFDGPEVFEDNVIGDYDGSYDTYRFMDRVALDVCQQHINPEEFEVAHCLMIFRDRYMKTSVDTYDFYAISRSGHVLPLASLGGAIRPEVKIIPTQGDLNLLTN